MDNRTIQSRSALMGKVRTKDTAAELIVRKHLFSVGLRYRKHVADLPGTPDIVLPKYKTVVFVHGCFWHGHTCRAGQPPKSNVKFWTQKVKTNKDRDLKVDRALKNLGWKVIIVYTCNLRSKVKFRGEMERLVSLIKE